MAKLLQRLLRDNDFEMLSTITIGPSGLVKPSKAMPLWGNNTLIVFHVEHPLSLDDFPKSPIDDFSKNHDLGLDLKVVNY